ncbi:hypothetical protein PFZ79_002719 [Enterococcus hirae]|nr:hypothetical protein [Enterococcus hirae]
MIKEKIMFLFIISLGVFMSLQLACLVHADVKNQDQNGTTIIYIPNSTNENKLIRDSESNIKYLPKTNEMNDYISICIGIIIIIALFIFFQKNKIKTDI